jgi:hypothetical protein
MDGSDCSPAPHRANLCRLHVRCVSTARQLVTSQARPERGCCRINSRIRVHSEMKCEGTPVRFVGGEAAVAAARWMPTAEGIWHIQVSKYKASWKWRRRSPIRRNVMAIKCFILLLVVFQETAAACVA